MGVTEDFAVTATRIALGSSPRWQRLTSTLPLMAVAQAEPVYLGACSDDALDEIQRWARGEGAEHGVPPLLAMYLEDVRKGAR